MEKQILLWSEYARSVVGDRLWPADPALGPGRLFILLARNFLLLVLLAFLVAAPVAGLAMQRWLEGYAYHTPLTISIFVIAGALACLIALLTVSYHAVRTALANPVVSLRAE